MEHGVWLPVPPGDDVLLDVLAGDSGDERLVGHLDVLVAHFDRALGEHPQRHADLLLGPPGYRKVINTSKYGAGDAQESHDSYFGEDAQDAVQS